MLIEELKNIKSTTDELRKFGKSVGGVLLLLGCILYYFDSHSKYIVIASGLILIAFAISKPSILKPLQKIWMALAVLLGWVSTRVILFMLFYLIITPIRLTAKLFGKEFLQLKMDKNSSTYWNYRNKKVFNPLDYEKQF